jgi:hypothetical protein
VVIEVDPADLQASAASLELPLAVSVRCAGRPDGSPNWAMSRFVLSRER